MFRESAIDKDAYEMWMGMDRKIKLHLDFDRLPRDLIHDIISNIVDELNIELSEQDITKLALWRKGEL